MGKKGGSNLGRQLVKKQTVHRKGTGVEQVGDEYLHQADLQDGYDWGRMNLTSVTEEASYIDFLNTAEQARHDFDAEKWNVKLLDAQTRKVYIDTTDQTVPLSQLSAEEQVLSIPRRPAWAGLTAKELSDKENDAFLDWRRKLAEVQETTDTIMTPYEKNLEFWRQLWRVIERSDLVITIVDARNPLLFRSQDLEKYVKEVSPLKKNLILLNKADFLTDKQRSEWATYLSENIGTTKFAFFSAITEDDPLNEEDDDIKVDEDDQSKDAISANEDALKHKLAELSLNSETSGTNAPEGVSTEEELPPFSDPIEILTSERLMQLMRTYKRHQVEHTTIGFIGYPNVGKSSTINKLLSSKKVRVSETPGKTKHFQTLILADDITLCDCPGLVMPSVVSSKEEMILNGILPCDQLRDCVPATCLLLQHIPTHVLEFKYGVVLPQEPAILGHEQVLTAYATMRGYMATGGRPDQSRAGRIILKDYVSGKLVHCVAPPTINQQEFHVHEVGDMRVWHTEEAKQAEALRLQRVKKPPQQVLDEKFFARGVVGAHIRGKSTSGRMSDKSHKSKKKTRIVYKEFDGKSGNSYVPPAPI